MAPRTLPATSGLQRACACEDSAAQHLTAVARGLPCAPPPRCCVTAAVGTGGGVEGQRDKDGPDAWELPPRSPEPRADRAGRVR